ncbi:hypothetical protein D3C76_1343050 [compost metagenome]
MLFPHLKEYQMHLHDIDTFSSLMELPYYYPPYDMITAIPTLIRQRRMTITLMIYCLPLFIYIHMIILNKADNTATILMTADITSCLVIVRSRYAKIENIAMTHNTTINPANRLYPVSLNKLGYINIIAIIHIVVTIMIKYNVSIIITPTHLRQRLVI